MLSLVRILIVVRHKGHFQSLSPISALNKPKDKRRGYFLANDIDPIRKTRRRESAEKTTNSSTMLNTRLILLAGEQEALQLKVWMPGSSPGMTIWGAQCVIFSLHFRALSAHATCVSGDPGIHCCSLETGCPVKPRHNECSRYFHASSPAMGPDLVRDRRRARDRPG